MSTLTKFYRLFFICWIAFFGTVKSEPVSIVTSLRPEIIMNHKDKDFSITCRARGKPKPEVTWLHNDQQISENSTLFRIYTIEISKDDSVFIVQSTLSFVGPSRSENELTPDDRGRYTCEFKNGFTGRARSEMMLRIQHSPIIRHTYNRVDFNLGETAVLECKMQTYPSPKFEWFFRERITDDYSKYGTNITDLDEEIYAGVLSIRNLKDEDYGEYTCRASNQAGDVKSDIITLVKTDQNKGQHAKKRNVSRDATVLPKVSWVHLLAATNEALLFGWRRPGHDNGVNITNYVLQLHYHHNSSLVANTTFDVNPAGKGNHMYTFYGLFPGETYDFQVQACNTIGCGLWSDPYEGTTDSDASEVSSRSKRSTDRFAEIAVSVPPKVCWVHLLGARNETLLYGWRRPDHDNGANITSYTLQLHYHRNGSLYANVTREIKVPGRQNHIYMFDALFPGETYDFQVRACNAIGCGLWSEPVVATTLDFIYNDWTEITDSSC